MKFNNIEKIDLVYIVKTKNKFDLKEVSEPFADDSGIKVSTSTIKRVLKKDGIRSRIARIKGKITKKQFKTRFAVAKIH